MRVAILLLFVLSYASSSEFLGEPDRIAVEILSNTDFVEVDIEDGKSTVIALNCEQIACQFKFGTALPTGVMIMTKTEAFVYSNVSKRYFQMLGFKNNDPQNVFRLNVYVN